ncbi:MAG: protein prkA, partial [Alicyclobacillus shizuokensis]|nr:protein prkA [Alicyclobacillus shizuokensis]
MSFLSRLNAYRAEEEELRWEGTFLDYLEIVRQNPDVAKTAHNRIYDMIADAGIETDADGRRHYRFFERELFGLDATIERLVEEYFHAAARRLEVRKRILLLMGPVSGGKSTIVAMLKRGLERYSRTPQGVLYGIKGCPMHEEPLHLIPEALRDEFAAEYGVRIEGNLCPACQLRLELDFGGDIEKVPVERVILSETKRVGIGTFSPSDPKSQDIADLTGSIDFSTITEYGSESDPRAYRFDGELNKANRGLMEFQEMLKCDEKFLWHLLSLTQEGNFKAGRFALISADEM